MQDTIQPCLIEQDQENGHQRNSRNEGIESLQNLQTNLSLKLGSAITNMTSVTKLLKSLLHQVNKSYHINVENEVNQIMKLQKIDDIVSQPLHELLQNIKEVKESWKRINEPTLEEVQINNLINQFSKQYKDKCVHIDGNKATVNNSDFGFCLLEPIIPQNRLVQYSFKINKCCAAIFIGICNMDLMSQVNYQPDLSVLEHGCALISNWGHAYSHHDNEINNKLKCFKFQTDDIILMQIDRQNENITWTKNPHSSNQTFKMKLKIHGDLYPVVGLRVASITIIH